MEQDLLEQLQQLMEQAGPYLAEASELAGRTGEPLGNRISLALDRIRQESAEVVALIIEAKRGSAAD
ncbi:MAG: hypothetical protein ACE5LD_05080 [Candidatus Bipolaricaulia bacterium]